MPLELSEAAIRTELTRELADWTLKLFPTIDSTNSYAKREAKKGKSQPGVVISDVQRSGRGRGNHTWESPGGVGLYLSILNSPIVEKSRLPAINLVAGIAAAEAIYRETQIDVSLKWPNDILKDGKKLGGILIEIASKNTLITGIGLNINNEDFPEPLKNLASSLHLLSDRKYDRNKIAASFINSFHSWSNTLNTSPQKVTKAWRELSSTIGQRITVMVSGKRTQGVAVDVDELGFLLLRDEHGKIIKITSGDLCCSPLI